MDCSSRSQAKTSDTSLDSKLLTIAVGAFRVLRNDAPTFLVDCDGVAERVFADYVAYGPSFFQRVPYKAAAVNLAAKLRIGPT